jgi:phosphoribosylamine--glycine ligase
MGTVATFERTGRFFERTLGKIEPHLRGRGHAGYVNLNTIVNDQGIWPLGVHLPLRLPGLRGARAAPEDQLGGPVRGA